MKFNSQVSWWYYAILALFVMMLGLSIFQFIEDGFDWVTFIIVIAYVIFIALSLIPQLVNTNYTLTDKEIIIRNGLQKPVAILIKRIDAVEKYVAKTPSVALGGRRLTIVYKDGKTKHKLAISPVRPHEFIEALKNKMIERSHQNDR